MSRTLKIYIVFLVLLIVGVVYIDAVRPKPIDWSPSYLLNDKIPYGLYIFDKEINTFLPERKIETVNVSAYEFLEPLYNYDKSVDDYSTKGTLLNVCDDYIIDDESTKELFYFVEKGNTCFLSSEELPKQFSDSLKIETDKQIDFTEKTESWLSNKNLGTEKYDLSRGAGNTYFTKIDTLNTTVLGYIGNDKKKHANFIRVPYKKGNFILHLQPNAFTNYHLLKDNHAEYASKVLAYMPKGNTYWVIKDQRSAIDSSSPFRYILSQPALRWAWYLFLIGIITFMVFNAKRRQRIIPIIKPLENTTVDFAKTIGNLYLQEGDHTNLMDKKIIYFLEKVRTEYLIDTTVLDENFIKKLQAKTQKEIKDIEHLIYLINHHRKNYNQSIESDLIALNSAIEKIIN